MINIKTLTQRNERGFTLIELLVVIAIIAVLAALVLAALSSAQKGSRDSRRKSDLNSYKTALAQYNADTNDYPATGNVTTTTALGAANGPCSMSSNYLSKCLPPPTQGGFDYIYVRGSANQFCMVTQLERDTANGFEITPTFSGKPSEAPTPGTANGSACVGTSN